MVGESKEREAQTWLAVFKQLVLWAVRRHGLSQADAEEVVQEGIGQYLAAGGVVDLADQKALRWGISSRINGIVNNRRRKKSLREDALDDESLGELVDVGPELRAIGDDIVRKAISELLERVEADDLMTGIVMQIADGVEDPADQAKALGRPIAEVYNARRRLKPHVEAVRKLMETW